MLKKILMMSLGLFMMGASGAVYAQDGTLSGTVTDAESGDPLPGANVYIEELETGTSVGADGSYEITGVEPGTYNVRVTYVGYSELTEEVEITSGDNNFDIEMESDAAELDEVVVTGYQEIQEEDYTGSVAQVSSDNFESSPISSIDQALEGNVAGANISSATGTPGAVQEVNIRGISSINAGTSPLYVIDGVPVESGSTSQSDATSSLGVLSNISASDIESVSVLKDAASTAAYGARGSNGVIVIETKDGQEGDVTYSVSTSRGFNNRAVEGPGSLNAEEWDELYYTSAANYLEDAGLSGADRDLVDQEIGPSGWDGETNEDWGDVVTNDDAVQQEYALSARGGNENTSFYASTNYFEQEGQTIGSQLERYSGRLNINHKLDDHITLDNSFNGSFVEQDGILEGAGYFGSPVLAEYFTAPIHPAYNDDGSPNLEIGGSTFNPVYVQGNDIDRKRNSRVLNNTTLDVQILDELAFTSNFSLDYILSEEKYYDNPFYGDGEDVRGAVNDINTRTFNYVWRNTLNYVFQTDEQNLFDLSLVSESQKNHTNVLDAYGEGIATEDLHFLNTTATPQDVGSSNTDWAVQSFTGLVNYSFDDKILVDLSLRQEGNSRFSEDSRWGTFWSTGLGYKFTEDDFFADIEWLDYLKARVSYGLTGNDAIGINNYQTLVGFGAYNDQPNIQPNQLGNPDLTWEKAKSFDAAIEFETFERLEGSIGFFHEEGYDLLFDVPLSYTTGHSEQVQNSGELYNQGFEFEMNADIINTDNIAWNFGGNLTLVENEITNLPLDENGDPNEITSSTQYQAVEGYEVNAFYMQEWAGVDPENGDPLWYTDDGDGGRTTTNDYNEADSYYQGGNSQPTEYGGISTRVDVFGFYVDADLSFEFGHKIYDNWANYMRSDGAEGYNSAFGQYGSQADYWEEPGDEAKNPRPVFLNTSNSNATSSRFLYDGDHLRLKSLDIGYNIPSEYLEGLGLQSATVYMNGRNMWTHVFDEDLEFDPEQKSSGFTDLSAQPMKSVTFGIKANF